MVLDLLSVAVIMMDGGEVASPMAGRLLHSSPFFATPSIICTPL